MIVRSRPRIVVLGRMTTMPYAGVVWQTLHYLCGFERLGFETFYVEAHAVAPRHFMRHAGDDGAASAAEFIDHALRRFGFGSRWAYQALASDGHCYGLGAGELAALYAAAELVVNLHGGTRPRSEHLAADRLVCIATDPVQMELELDRRLATTVEFFRAHQTVFTFGENYGKPGSRLPVTDGFPLLPTRQPVVLELWTGDGETEPGPFTTVANWRQQRALRYAGECYEWSKHLEFLKVVDLPQRTRRPLELALSRCPPEDQRTLVEHGWRLRDALELSSDLDVYRRYLEGSHGEFTVAKDQNVRLRSGWFSDRSATYLAAGRPVVTQDTGFGDILPTGEGLFAFSNVADAAAAIDEIDSDYPRHRRAAREIAREYFSHDVVLGSLLERSGVALPALSRRPARGAGLRVALIAHRYPPDARGGVEFYTERLAMALAAEGKQVTVLARRPAPGPERREIELTAGGVCVHRLTGGRIRRQRFLADREALEPLVRTAFAESDPELVHVQHVLDLPPGLLVAAKERGAALVITLHDYFFACPRIVLRTGDGGVCEGPRGGWACGPTCFEENGHGNTPRWPLRALYFRRLLELADRVVCPSRHVAEFFTRMGINAERLRVVGNGVWVGANGDLAIPRRTPQTRGRLALGFLGALVPHKGLRMLLDALARARLDAVDLTVYGVVGDPREARELCALGDAVPGLRFRLYGDYASDELPALIADLDAIVVPSQWPETFCLVASEALAQGIPIVVSRLGALPDAVEEGVNGFTFDHDDTVGLGNVLRRLAEEEGLLARLRAGAFSTRVATFAEHLAALEDVYGEAIEEAEHPPRGGLAERDELTALEATLTALGFGSPAVVHETDGQRAHREETL